MDRKKLSLQLDFPMGMSITTIYCYKARPAEKAVLQMDQATISSLPGIVKRLTQVVKGTILVKGGVRDQDTDGLSSRWLQRT